MSILESKSALVTGGTSEIGTAICRALKRDGFEIAFTYKSSKDAAKVLENELGAVSLRADVSDFALLSDFIKKRNGFNVLVTNAGSAQYGVFQDVSKNWKSVFESNFGGTVNAIDAVLPYMINRKHGSIVTISSVWGIAGASCESIYAASKAAVIGLTKSLSQELAPSGIRVNCVAPGVIGSGMTMTAFHGAELDTLRERVPLGRLGTPEDVAELTAFLCSEKASYITGQVIEVGGGFS